MSYNGWRSAAYHSADGSGHVITALRGDVPAPFDPAGNPTEREAFLDRVLSDSTGAVTLADHQVLMLFELAEEDLSDSDVTYQSIAVVLTFTPDALHDTNCDNDDEFDGYDSRRSSDPIGPAATAYAGEHDFSWTSAHESELEDEEQSSDDQTIAAQNLSGSVNLNPGKNRHFEFYLRKPGGTTICRDDLLASFGELEYTGPAALVRFKPKGNGNQNSIVLNGETFLLQNSHVYTITASDLSVHLYNDRTGNGAAMGHWWLDSLSASDAQISDGGVDANQDTDYTGEVLSGDSVSVGGRSLGRGTRVSKGRRVKATAYH
jgi:hypothetical protein